MPETLVLDTAKLTMGDIEDIEEYAGKPIGEILASDAIGNVKVSGRSLTAIVWVLKRKENPAFTIDDARNTELGSFDLSTTPVDPTDAAGSSS